MALTGLDIYKQLPKTNCGECGTPTCLAFAMKIASKQASLDECPYVTEEAKAALGSASQPPIKLVTIGSGENKIELGNETVLFRHEETFYHETAIAIRIKESDPEAEKRLDAANNLKFIRVGMEITVNMLALEEDSKNPDSYASFVEKIAGKTDLNIVLISFSPDCLKAALEKIKEKKPLLYAATEDNFQETAPLAKEAGCPLVVKAEGLEKLAELTAKITKLGGEDLVLDSTPIDLHAAVTEEVIIRRQALKKHFRPLGYPTIAFTTGKNDFTDALEASVSIPKYVSILATNLIKPEYILPILTTRQNIYTDPQKPIQMEPKLYTVGEPDRSSPVMVTTNFSLTYFTVEGEVEASRVPSYIIVVDTEGTSVLTAWAADKFNPEIIAKAMNDYKVSENVDHKNLIIPGYVAVLSGKLEDESGWKILVGPREASGIPKYLKSTYKTLV